MRKVTGLCLLILSLFSFTGCYSVFSGGIGGLLVDAESPSNPKEGIANVDVYAYTDEGERNRDFNAWTEGTIFAPKTDYYGHTTTGADGRFTLSKLVWKAGKTDFGRDADYTKVYLLFYHENYGLTKGSTVIISDSTTDTVYAELKSVRKTTLLNISLLDIASGSAATIPAYVKVTVPQTTAANTTAPDRVYESTITGDGTITISYPRWKNSQDKAAGIENEPTVTIDYVHSADTITWMGCYMGDNADGNFAFRADANGVTEVTKNVKNPAFSITLYGKSIVLSVPPVQGQYVEADSEADDGIIISMKGKDMLGNYTIDCGEATTSAQTLGTTNSQKHGMFSGLGAGSSWIDTTYTGKFASLDVKIYADGVEKKEMTLRSDKTGSYDVQF